MVRLSIIIPFYNVEQYIAQCLDSVYQQDIPEEEYEVICVNDCSPDKSREVVVEYREKHANLKLVEHERNKKLGGARNTGLKAANGQYIWYVDSDDELMPNVLGKLLETAEKGNLDILQFEYAHERHPQPQEQNLDSTIQRGEAYLFEKEYWTWAEKVCGAWRQLIRRAFVVEKEMTYIEDAMYEDTDYLIHLFVEAERVQKVSIIGYMYRENESSITKAPLSAQKLAWRVNLIARCSRYYTQVTTEKARRMLQQMIANSLSRIREDINRLSCRQKMEYLRKIAPELISCKPFVNWRTWLAIRYAITLFIKK